MNQFCVFLRMFAEIERDLLRGVGEADVELGALLREAVVDLGEVLVVLLREEVVRFLEVELDEVVRAVIDEPGHGVGEERLRDLLGVEPLDLRLPLREVDEDDPPGPELVDDLRLERAVGVGRVELGDLAELDPPRDVGRPARLLRAREEDEERLELLVGPLVPLVALVIREEVGVVVLVPDPLEPVGRLRERDALRGVERAVGADERVEVLVALEPHREPVGHVEAGAVEAAEVGGHAALVARDGGAVGGVGLLEVDGEHVLDVVADDVAEVVLHEVEAGADLAVEVHLHHLETRPWGSRCSARSSP